MTAAGTPWWPETRTSLQALDDGIKLAMAEKPTRMPDHVVEFGKGAAASGGRPPRCRRHSTATTRRSGRCCRSSSKTAPATFWKSAAAPGSTRSPSPGNGRRSPGGRPISTTITCAASPPGANTRNSATCRPPRHSTPATAIGGSPSAACRNSSSRCSAPTSSTSRRGRWRKACSPAPAAICGADGRLFLYGPFKRDGEHNAPSNAAFDASLRRQNPEWGVRDTADLRALAENNRLRFAGLTEMPANNAILAFERK